MTSSDFLFSSGSETQSDLLDSAPADPVSTATTEAVFSSSPRPPQLSLEDFYGSVSDYNKALEIGPTNLNIYKNRGISKENVGDIKGACFDWKKASSLGDEDAKKWFKDDCKKFNKIN